MTTVADKLTEITLERGLRQTTMLGYERLLRRMELLHVPFDQVTKEHCMEALWKIDNPNTRRSAVVALRSVFGFSIKIPKSIPRRYDLPDEDTLRMALMFSKQELRGLLMMYAGLRVGEACAITEEDVRGDRLRVDKQVIQLHRTGHPTVLRIAPVKTAEADVVIPYWLSERLVGLQGTVKPDAVRESLRRAGRKFNINLNPHMLRHFYATHLLAKGVPLIVVSRQMRHSDIATTLRTYAQGNDASSIHDALG